MLLLSKGRAGEACESFYSDALFFSHLRNIQSFTSPLLFPSVYSYNILRLSLSLSLSFSEPQHHVRACSLALYHRSLSPLNISGICVLLRKLSSKPTGDFQSSASLQHLCPSTHVMSLLHTNRALNLLVFVFAYLYIALLRIAVADNTLREVLRRLACCRVFIFVSCGVGHCGL